MENDEILEQLAELCDTYERASGCTVGLHLTVLGDEGLHEEYDWNGESMYKRADAGLELAHPDLGLQVLHVLRRGKLGKQSRRRLKEALRGRNKT